MKFLLVPNNKKKLQHNHGEFHLKSNTKICFSTYAINYVASSYATYMISHLLGSYATCTIGHLLNRYVTCTISHSRSSNVTCTIGNSRSSYATCMISHLIGSYATRIIGHSLGSYVTCTIDLGSYTTGQVLRQLPSALAGPSSLFISQPYPPGATETNSVPRATCLSESLHAFLC